MKNIYHDFQLIYRLTGNYGFREVHPMAANEIISASK